MSYPMKIIISINCILWFYWLFCSMWASWLTIKHFCCCYTKWQFEKDNGHLLFVISDDSSVSNYYIKKNSFDNHIERLKKWRPERDGSKGFRKTCFHKNVAFIGIIFFLSNCKTVCPYYVMALLSSLSDYRQNGVVA